jgi:hypothetical protein
MAYYDALVAKWPSVTGANTAAKLANLNGQTVAASGTQDVSASAIFNVLLGTLEWGNIELMSRPLPTGTLGPVLNAADANVAKLITFARIVQSGITIPTSNAAIATSLNSLLTQMVTAHLIAAGTQTTIVALATPPPVPWWQSNGYLGPINLNDLAAAGNLT